MPADAHAPMHSVAPNSDHAVLVFVPTYADRGAIPRIAAEVAQLGPGYRALIVDDGSDPPVERPDERCLHVRLNANYGLGVSTQIAFHHALRWRYQAVVRVDADGQHVLSDIPRLLEALKTADLVVGVRTNEDRSNTLDAGARRVMKAYFNFVARLMTGGGAPRDVNSGLFAANAVAMQRLSSVPLERFPEPQIAITACRAGLRVVSVPVQQRPRGEGRSSINVTAALGMFFRFNVFALTELMRPRR